MDINNVKQLVCIFSSLDEQETERFAPIIEGAVNSVEAQLKDTCDTENASVSARLCFLAAAQASYLILLSAEGGDGVTSFKAGDISISQGNDGVSRLSELVQQARLMCNDLTCDSGFAFMEV